MGTNHHTAWAASTTQFTAASMNPALADLDKAITYHKLALVGCDGSVTWAAGTLTWSDTLHIYFTSAAGNAVHNSVAASSIALSDSEFAYVTLSETPDAVLTMAKAAIGAGSASAFKTYNILVMGYRNAGDDGFYPEELAGVFAAGLSAGSYVAKSLYDAGTLLYAADDNTPVVKTLAEFRALLGNLDGRPQAITCADNVTIDWSAGATAKMTFDRGAVAFTFSNPVAGQVYRLLLVQGDGSDLATWTTTIKWAGGAAPTLSTAAGAEDWITFVYEGASWYGSATLNFATV
jgi:hypothetical protein